jgi:RNA polymerase sigma factor (sigma-70 family)
MLRHRDMADRFEDWYRDNHRLIRLMGSDWAGRDFDRTAEIAAIVALKLWRRSLRTLEVDVDRAFVRAIVRNVAIDLRRADHRHQRCVAPADRVRLQEDERQRDRRGRIHSALDQAVSILPRRERAVIARVLDGLSLREIGAEMGISRQKAGRLKRRALPRLRFALELMVFGVPSDDARTIGRTHDTRDADTQAERATLASSRDLAVIVRHIAEAWGGSPGHIRCS